MRISNYTRPGSAARNAPGTPGSTGGTLGSVTDGTTTVSPVTGIDVAGGTVTDLGGGIAEITIAGGMTVQEIDGTPSVAATELDVPNGSLSVVGTVATLAYAQKINGGREKESVVAASGASQTLNLANGNLFDVTLTANCTLTFSGAVSGEVCSFTLWARQDGVGSHTITWPGSVTWSGGSAPTLATAAGSLDEFVFVTTDGGTTWIGHHIGGTGVTYATPAIVLGTAAAAGAAASVIRSDSTIAAFDATVPTTQAFGDAAATGSAAFAARRDHLHGMPAAPASGSDHEHIGNVTFNGDGSTVAFTLPAAPFDAYSVAAYVAGARTDVTLSGALLDVMTFAIAPASGTGNIVVDIVAAV